MLTAKPTNKTSRSSAPMRIQKPARGIAAVKVGAADGAAEGGAAEGGVDAEAGGGSAAILGPAPAAALAAGAALAVHPGPAMVAALGGGEPLAARRARTRSTSV